MRVRVLLSLAAVATMGGCATMPLGDTQSIQLSVSPAMAQCNAIQHGQMVGSYDPSSQTLTVPTSQGSTDIFCSATGFKDKRVTIVPDNAGRGSLGYLALDLGPIDPAYPANVRIEMEPADRQGQPS